jgi:hypothetical protein
LEDEKHWADEEAQTVSWLPEFTNGEAVFGRRLSFEADLHLVKLVRSSSTSVTSDPGDGFPSFVGAMFGEEPAA